MFKVALLGSTSVKNKTTQVVFVPENTEAPIWVSAWMDTEFVQDCIRPGIEIVAEHSVFGDLETTWVNKEGVTVALAKPRQVVTFRGTIQVIAPALLPEAQYVANDEAKAYAQKYDARKAQVGDDTPI